ncbi:hypothetical protein [Sulfurimonas sp.]|uniref:hypothetical protein n=1 Tax=Sulfurimonas sp. TaxID=2022749 RepID=UPI002B48F5F1|nr:hypothetical protein [Sulfurimonas sp.]
MRKIILTIGLIASIFLSGCGYKEGVATATKKSYLYFTGNINDTMISVDNGDKFSVQAGKNYKYSVKPGKHLVEIYRNNILIIKRNIFISDGISKEIEVQ